MTTPYVIWDLKPMSSSGGLSLPVLPLALKKETLPRINYTKAIEALEKGSYEKAQIFLSEADYNKEELISYVVDSIEREEIYRAVAVMEFLGESSYNLPDIQNSLFEKASEMLKKEKYSDITRYIKYINDTNLINRLFEQATPVVISLIENEEIDTVLELFAILSDDFCNKQDIQEALFQKAKQLIETDDLELLLNYSLRISDKALKDNYYSLCNTYAFINFNKGNYKSALTLFMELYGTKYEAKDYAQTTQSILLVINDFDDNLVNIETVKLVDQKNLYSYLPDNCYNVINKMKSFVYSMQGAYKGGIRYFYVAGLDVYWGGHSGCLDFSMSYDIGNDVWKGDYGEDLLEANNNNIKTTLRVYQKISKDNLPYTFSEVISD